MNRSQPKGHGSRTTLLRLTAGVAIATLAGALLAPVAASTSPSDTEAVIVRARPGAVDAAAADVTAFGGHVGRALPIIDGFAATVPTDRIDALRAEAGVLSVTPDQSVHPMSIDPTLGYDPVADMGSSAAITQMVGAQAVWANGITGKGIGVALIDTGVTQVPGLDQGQVVDGPDLSFDSQNPALEHLDAYGHGTHMASLIVGRDAGATASAAGCTTCLNSSGFSDTTKFVGVAPEATLVNVKVGAADGSADVSQVIAAIDWVVQHRNDNGLNIKVLNLSYGTNSGQPYTVDPLAYAAEVAWRNGIVVVASGGNDGMAVKNLASPAYDPMLVAVGGEDPKTTLSLSDDTVPAFATHGTNTRKVDVAAPAVHILGLRVPGSYVDSLADNAGRVGDRFQRGSGTSQAAAITSGVVALDIQRYPTASVDNIKQLLVSTTGGISAANALYRGRGMPNAYNAYLKNAYPTRTQSWVPGTGTGSIQLTRGTSAVADSGVVLTGEMDIFGRSWRGGAWAADAFAGRSWRGGEWNGGVWTGDGWTGRSWRDATWTSADWAGNDWAGRSWRDVSWDGRSWRNNDWSGRSWRGSTWNGSTWSAANWG
jgi:serine protease AprX